jgi:apolipoprotein N-acyltransferase
MNLFLRTLALLFLILVSGVLFYFAFELESILGSIIFGLITLFLLIVLFANLFKIYNI